MSKVQTYSVTVTHSDVLYVSQQIQLDLRALSVCYPNLVSMDRVVDLGVSIGTLLINDAVKALGFSVHDRNLVLHELRYVVTYTGTGPRTGVGGASIAKVYLPPTAQFTPWVTWSETMLRLPEHKQRQIVAATSWGVPGTSTFSPRYDGTSTTQRASYGSGPLVADAEEIRRY